jgi:two-component system sensor histidine kinase/response regulator
VGSRQVFLQAQQVQLGRRGGRGAERLTIDLATNGQEAVDKVARQDYDAVLMDLQMPVMDGLDATRAIRKLPDRQDLPIIAMTANAMSEDRQRCIEAGMNDHIAKPIDPDALWDTLAKWMRRAPAEPVTEASAPAAPAPAAPADPMDALRLVPGLDVEAGLKFMLGKQALYLSIARKFAAGAPAQLEATRDALAKGDMKTAEREIHTLKSMSATLGAEPTQAAAAALEAAIRKGAAMDEIAARLEAMKAPLAALSTAMQEALSP